tara:strand:+ start:202 stop:327 length:126 start_codon:yes stop_codon:yes gene_type:complete
LDYGSSVEATGETQRTKQEPKTNYDENKTNTKTHAGGYSKH